MSVIPLRIDGPRPTVVDSADTFEKAGGRRGAAVLIRGLDRDQLNPQKKRGNLSYDLRVGNEYRDHRETGKRDLSEGDEIRLLPGMAVVIETMEEVHFPESVFGLIVSKVSLSQEGVSNVSTKIDPGYYGRLQITTYNLGKKTVSLRPGDLLCSLSLLTTGEGAQPYDGPSKKLQGMPTGRLWDRVRYRVEANTGFWLVVVSIVTALLLGLELLRAFLGWIGE